MLFYPPPNLGFPYCKSKGDKNATCMASKFIQVTRDYLSDVSRLVNYVHRSMDIVKWGTVL